MANAALKLKVQTESINGTVLTIVTAVVGMVVGLGVISSAQQGLIIATTTAGLAAAGTIANALHSGTIEPSAITTTLLAVAGQVVSLVVSFALISNQEAGTIISIITAVIGGVVVVAHALQSKKVPA